MRITKWIFAAYFVVLLSTNRCQADLPPRDPNTAYFAYFAHIKSLDPALYNDTETSDILGNVYETLYNYKHGAKPYELIPELAAQMPQVSDDGLVYTIKIRRRIKFYDPQKKAFADGIGPEVKPSDFVYAFKRVGNFTVGSPNFSTLFQDRVVGIDDWYAYTQETKKPIDYGKPVAGLIADDANYTLTIKLKEPYPQFVHLLTYQASAPMCQRAVETYGDQLTQVAVGTGAYGITRYNPDSHVVLEANPVYRGRPDLDGDAKIPADERMPFVKRVEYDYFGESKDAWESLMAGKQEMGGIPKEVLATVADVKAQELRPEFKARGMRLEVTNSTGLFYFGFNMDDPVVGKNKPLRQAMSMAFDREKYIQTCLGGRGVAADRLIPSSFEAYDPAQVNEYARFDLEAAKKKLAEARQIRGGEIPQLTLSIGATLKDDVSDAELFASQMKELGLKVKIDPLRWVDFQNNVDQRKTQVFSMGWIPDYPDEQTFLQLFYGPNAPQNGINPSAYRNAEFDKLYAQASKLPPSPQRLALYKKMVGIVNEDCPWLCSFYSQDWRIQWKWVSGTSPMDFGSGYLQYMKIDFEMRAKTLADPAK